MKTIFIDSYKTIDEHCTVIFQDLSDLKISIIFNRITSKIGIYTLYALINQLFKFHRNQTSSSAIPTV